jgi:hypothetical protein
MTLHPYPNVKRQGIHATPLLNHSSELALVDKDVGNSKNELVGKGQSSLMGLRTP